ncbi:hypothetical protein PoB_001657000 [Plakobranchus ocellatus]|uniref:Uncharacterized protein n=1 Tax=Plakobranchus ocellatus TaxID=259542 RepID=A0AAV3Z3R0_9GAST|nr:hypothetical protein PoB_001657000 [Plakobranchus ocellatus]
MEQPAKGADPLGEGHAHGHSHSVPGPTHSTPVPAIVAIAGVDAKDGEGGEAGEEGADSMDDRRGSALSDASDLDGEHIADRLSTFTIRKQTSYRMPGGTVVRPGRALPCLSQCSMIAVSEPVLKL